MAEMTGGQALVQSLRVEGVDVMFGLPGVQLDWAFDALYAERDHLRVQLEPGPEYVIEWIRDFYDIECMPRVLKRSGGGNVLAADEDALVVGGVLSALAAVEEVRETTYAETRTPGRQVRTFVSPGGPWPPLHVPGTT